MQRRQSRRLEHTKVLLEMVECAAELDWCVYRNDKSIMRDLRTFQLLRPLMTIFTKMSMKYNALYYFYSCSIKQYSLSLSECVASIYFLLVHKVC